MIGIYKVENKINKKVYIGQSVNIKNRWESHKNNHNNANLKDFNTKFYKALRKYGIDNFSFEIVEECSKEKLDEREIYWIRYFDSFKNGYNSTIGGQIGNTIEENHPMTDLTNLQILELKKELKESKISEYELAKKYSISQSEISNINRGKRWSTIGDYSYPIRKLNQTGERNPRAIFTNEEVLEIRKQYVTLSGRKVYEKYKDRCSYTAFERILLGKTYTDVPIYKKSLKKWISL